MFDTITRRRSDVAIKNRILTTTVAVLAHLGVLTAVIVVPLWYFTPALPEPFEIMAFVAAPPLPPPPPPPPPPAAAPSRPARHEPVKPAPSPDRFAAPVERRPGSNRRNSQTLAARPASSEASKAVSRAESSAELWGDCRRHCRPRLRRRTPPTKPAPVHIGGQIKAPALLVHVDPVYR